MTGQLTVAITAHSFKYLGMVNATNRRDIDVQQELQLPESLGQDITNMQMATTSSRKPKHANIKISNNENQKSKTNKGAGNEC